MAYWNDSATSNYVNYLGTNDRTIRPPTIQEQQLAAQQAKDAADRKAAADAAAAAQRERLRQEQVAAQQRAQDLAAQQAAEARQRQYALQDAATKRRQELEDRAAAQARADALMNQFGFGGAAGGDGGGGGAMGALTQVAGGGGGVIPAGGGGAALMTLPDTTAADSAARTQAKEKAALRLQSSMRGLDMAMGQRGIRGSGLHSQGMSDLFGQSATDEANAEMDRLNKRADLEFQVGGRNQDAANQLNIANMQAQQWAAERADKLASEQRQLALTLAQFGMKY